MRSAMLDTQWLLRPDGQLAGLALGYDFCAEHEYGSHRLHRDFGLALPNTPIGLEDRKMTRMPDFELIFLMSRTSMKPARSKGRGKSVPTCLLAYVRGADYPLLEKLAGIYSNVKLDTRMDVIEQVRAAWSDEDFAILVSGKENVQRLQQLHQAFLRKDILFGAGLDYGWANGRGLTFLMDSAVDNETRAAVLQQDLAREKLQEAAEATKIEERLKAAGRHYHALAPAWLDEKQGTVRFFLNPVGQEKNNFGWFTVEELDAWIRGEGPIPKQTNAVA